MSEMTMTQQVALWDEASVLIKAADGSLIPAVRRVREVTGWDLKPALDFVRAAPTDLASQARRLRAQAADLVARAEAIEAALTTPHSTPVAQEAVQ